MKRLPFLPSQQSSSDRAENIILALIVVACLAGLAWAGASR